MTLSLDHQARINLAALVGSVECKTLSETKAAWALMDKFELSDQEKSAIAFEWRHVEGNDIPTWDPTKRLPRVDIELNDSESARIMRALETARVIPGPMRRWLEPVLAQMPANGAAK